MATPYYTSSDLIAAVKRKIMFPISQSTFTANDILAFANEEMFISQVPAVLEVHEEYFVFRDSVPLQTNISRYSLPTRAIGMRLRDLMWADSNNNFFDMTRILADDKAYFQRNIGANQAIHKFYMEGNDVVLTPSVTSNPTGYLLMTYFLRPNQLVPNARAATVNNFVTNITVKKSLITALDTFSINSTPFTAVNTLGGTITGISVSENTYVTSVGHQLSTGQTVILSGTNSVPDIDGTWTVTVIDSDTFQIDTQVITIGTTGTFTCSNQFQIGATDIATATNLMNAFNAVSGVPGIPPAVGFPSNQGGNQSFLPGAVSTTSNIVTPASFTNTTTTISATNSNTRIVTLYYNNINTTFSTTNNLAFITPANTMGVCFDSLPSTYTDPDTNVTTALFTVGSTVDFLQTNPGHKSYAIDVPIQSISGNIAYFTQNDLIIYTDTSLFYDTINLKVGDYICLANECIIPQIPPELHPGLAERTCARILAAIGDRDALAVVNQKIQDISVREGELIDQRTEGNPMKVLNRNSLLRMGKTGTRRL